MNSFCINCGARFEESARFCSGCGATRPISEAVSVVVEGPPIISALPKDPGSGASSSAPASGKWGPSLLRVIVTVVSILLLFGLLGLGGCIYVAYRIKNKAMQVAESVTQEGQDALKTPLGPSSSDHTAYGSAAAQDVHCPAAPAVSASDKAAIVPLVPGLTIVEAWHVSYGDMNSLKTLIPLPLTRSGSSCRTARITTKSIVRSVARTFRTPAFTRLVSGMGTQEIFRGTTLFSVSATVLNDLKTKRRATFTYTQTVDEAGRRCRKNRLASMGARRIHLG